MGTYLVNDGTKICQFLLFRILGSLLEDHNGQHLDSWGGCGESQNAYNFRPELDAAGTIQRWLKSLVE